MPFKFNCYHNLNYMATRYCLYLFRNRNHFYWNFHFSIY